MDKSHLIAQLQTSLLQVVEGASSAAQQAAAQARLARDPRERQADSGAAVELANMARGQGKRRERALAELEALGSFHASPLQETAAVTVGALVELEDLDSGEGRTLFLAPAGAGTTLYGPGGDGHVTVATPFSPVGRALMGCRVGDSIDVTVRGEAREWELTWVG